MGTAVLDRLSRYDLSVLLLEKEDDVAASASRANSGIVHAGYDCEPDTLKARFNVRGNELMWQLAEELDVPHLKCGSIVVARREQLAELEKLKNKGDVNGVETRILNRAQTLMTEPHIGNEIEYALFAPQAGVISPYQLTIALADRAIINGAAVKTESEVVSIEKTDGGVFYVQTAEGDIYQTDIVINCAGAYAAKINDLAGAEHYETQFRRGDYFVLDNTERKNISTVIFPLPTSAGKGILVAPTADRNVIYGPTSIETDADDTASSAEGLAEIRRNVPLSYSGAAFNKCIRVYSGVRSIVGHDFVVKQSDLVSNFVMALGICSPGLTSAPAIAEYIENTVSELKAPQRKQDSVTFMPRHKRLSELDSEKLNELIRKDANWGKIVCRCEKVSEAEIIEAIRSPLPARTVDAVKRRTRAGMGRCQGGFCGPRVMEILSRELNIPLNSVKKGMDNSEIARYAIKETDNA